MTWRKPKVLPLACKTNVLAFSEIAGRPDTLCAAYGRSDTEALANLIERMRVHA